MKDFTKALKWIFRQAKPFTLPLLLIVMSGAVLSICGVSLAVMSKNLIDAAMIKNNRQITQTAICFGSIILLQIVLQAFFSMLSVRTLEALSNRIRQKLFIHMSTSLWTDFSRYHSGDISTRMTSDVSTVASGVVNVFPGIVSLAVRLAAAFGTLFFFDPVLAVLAFLLGPIAILFSRFFGRKLKHLHIKIQESESAYRIFLQESLQNMLIIKSFCLEPNRIDQMSSLQNNRLEWVLRRNRFGTGTNIVLSLGYWIGYFLAFAWGALRLSSGAATFGTLTVFFQLVNQIQSPFVGLAYSFPQIIATTASVARLLELEALQSEEIDNQTPDRTCSGLSFRNVGFYYKPDKPILTNVSFDIQAGEMAAIIGASGEGKTTLIRLILSLLHPEHGQIYFTDSRGFTLRACASTRTLISYVPQGNTLFSGTIAENLRLGSLSASDAELENAARAACALEFIESLPARFNTVIGENGLGLSEGQAQRLAIARALVCKAPILVFDEATSALDVHTEMNLLHNLPKYCSGRTCIIITHRPAALKVCSKILKIKDGHVVEHRNVNSMDVPDLAI